MGRILTQQMQQITLLLELLQPILLRLLPVMMKRTQAHLVMMLEPLLLQLQVQFL